ncbi:MAG: DMT family transporter [Planctomycetota bacterium]
MQPHARWIEAPVTAERFAAGLAAELCAAAAGLVLAAGPSLRAWREPLTRVWSGGLRLNRASIGRAWLIAATTVAMLAFAGNSVLGRLAMRPGMGPAIDPVSFTWIRTLSGAAVLFAVVGLRRSRARSRQTGLAANHNRAASQPSTRANGSWLSALALAVDAAAFGFASVALATGVGALVLFASVQFTMLGHGLLTGRRLSRWEWRGLFLAAAGLVCLFACGVSGGLTPLGSSAVMATAGVAWGVYSIRGRRAQDAAAATAGNFARAAVLLSPAVVAAALLGAVRLPAHGVWLAVAAGAIFSGAGYAVWYSAVRSLSLPAASMVQLTVPVIAGIGGVLCLSEAITLRLLVSDLMVVGGLGVAIIGGLHAGKPTPTPRHVGALRVACGSGRDQRSARPAPAVSPARA